MRETSSNRVRSTKPPRWVQSIADDVPESYNRGGYVGSLAVAILLFLVLWLLNGLSTAWASRPLFFWLLTRVGTLLGQPVSITIGMLWGLGWIMHIAVSLIERHLWKSGKRLFYPISVPANAWDMLTASMAMKMFFFESLSGGTLLQNAFYVLLGFLLSLSEIPLIIASSMLWKELRGEE